MTDVAQPVVSRSFAAPRTVRPRRVDIPATADLLVDGGDSRLALDLECRANKYGCGPRPDPRLIAFGSSTASVISERGFAAAERLRRRLVKAAASEPSHVTYARELGRLRRDLLRLCGVSDGAGIQAVFAASGTDLHLIAAQLAGASGRVCAIAVEATETGSGVPAALAGRHFSTSTAHGQSVIDGTAVSGAAPVEMVPVAGRSTDGTLRAAADVAAAVALNAMTAVNRGRRVLLVLADVSKTGILSPGLDCVLDLKRRLGERLDVLVDGCQFRLAPATLRAYLAHGFMVAVTGSKFLTGPAFSGALLVPPQMAQHVRDRALPAGLAAYSARAEWPSDWTAAENLPDLANYGLLLRWKAALAELEPFAALSDGDVAGFAAEFGRAVAGRLAADPHLEAVPAPVIDRSALSQPSSWDRLPTIFPVLLRRAGGYLTRPETERVYKRLAAERVQLGQPVACGVRDGVAVSALRLCLSARLIVEAVADGRAQAVIERAVSVLDRSGQVIDGR